jgi:NAD(P)-dependent dehydrogenase (short-subunit alcohol dehydrogenase family)
MGREVAKQLASEGCHVAICDVSAEHMAETRSLCEQAAPPGTRISTHLCDVLDESQVRPSPKEMTAEDLRPIRERMAQQGLPADALSDDQLRLAMQQLAEDFRDKAPLSAAAAAKIIFDGVRAGDWRILVGEDAKELDRMVRAAPERAYEPGFLDELRAKGHLRLSLAPGS